jgi:hypothetical protein
MSHVERDMRREVYLSLLLLGADPILLGAAASWANGMADEEVLTDVRNWNEAKVLELKEWLPTMSGEQLESVQQRIAQYESQGRTLEKAA